MDDISGDTAHQQRKRADRKEGVLDRERDRDLRKKISHPPGIIDNGREKGLSDDRADNAACQRSQQGIGYVFADDLYIGITQGNIDADLASLFIDEPFHGGQAD